MKKRIRVNVLHLLGCASILFILFQFFRYDKDRLYVYWLKAKRQISDDQLLIVADRAIQNSEKINEVGKIKNPASKANQNFIDKRVEVVTKKYVADLNDKSKMKSTATKAPTKKKLAPPRPVIDDIKPPPWDKPVDLRIISLVFNRSTSLKRQLDSLNTAEYYGDNVLVEIWIDRSKKDGKIDPKTYLVAKNFSFKYGDVRVINHTRHVGLYGQWMGTWQPDPKSEEIAVFLEDDVSVSPFFYRWLKNVHKKYDQRNDIAGYSLRGTCPRYKGSVIDLRAPKTEFCMLYRATGSWGISPHRENWFKYVEWYKNASKDRTFQPFVPGIIPTMWYQIFMKRGTTDDMWTMWHIYYTHVNNQFTLFLNFPNKMGLTSHWQEAGLHYSKQQTLKNNAPILTKWDPRYDDLPDKLVKLDYDGKIIK